jgi:hypothetical protein
MASECSSGKLGSVGEGIIADYFNVGLNGCRLRPYCNASSGWVGRLPERETRDIATPILPYQTHIVHLEKLTLVLLLAILMIMQHTIHNAK